MQETDLATPFAPGPSLPSRRSNAFLRLILLVILFASCAMLFAATSRAQENDQDVAAAARQERARKEALQKKSPHVYTEEDLKHPQILTPEDHAQVEAKKIPQPAAPPEKSEQSSQQSADANSLPPDAPLGDVARHYRQQKQLQKLQQSAQFHLPVAGAPALASPQPPLVAPANPPASSSPMPMILASPKPPVLAPSKPSMPFSPNPSARPLQPRSQIFSQPVAPHFAPYRPPVKRSPFERPKFFTAEPTPPAPTRPVLSPNLATPIHPLAPKPAVPARHLLAPKFSSPQPPAPELTFASPPLPFVAPKLFAPSRPVIAPARVAPRRFSPEPQLASPPETRVLPHFASPALPSLYRQLVAPARPFISSNPAAHTAPSHPKRTSSPSPALGTKLVAPTHTSLVPEFAAPSRPALEFNFANPSQPIAKPKPPVSKQLAPKFKLLAPSRAAAILTVPSIPHLPPAISSSSTVITIKRGDSLWKLAKQNLGSGIRWRELLSANPSIHNPNLIRAGSQLVLPPTIS